MSPPLPAGAACGWEMLDVPRVPAAPRSVTAHPCHICLPRSAHPAWAAVVVAWGFVPPMFHTPGVEMEKREMWGFGGMYFVLCFFFLMEATCGAACAGVGVGLAGGADVWSGWCRWGGNGADGAMLGVPAAAGLPVTFCLQLFRRSFLEPCHRLGPQPARRVPGLRCAAGGAGQGAGTGGGRRGQSRGTRHCHWLGTARDFHRHLSNRDLLQHFTFLRRSARPRAKRSLL